MIDTFISISHTNNEKACSIAVQFLNTVPNCKTRTSLNLFPLLIHFKNRIEGQSDKTLRESAKRVGMHLSRSRTRNGNFSLANPLYRLTLAWLALFSFAGYPVARYGDESVENPP